MGKGEKEKWKLAANLKIDEENEGGKRRREEKSTRVFHTLPRRLWLWLFRFIYTFFSSPRVYTPKHTKKNFSPTDSTAWFDWLEFASRVYSCCRSHEWVQHRNGFWLPFVTVSSDNRQVFNFTSYPGGCIPRGNHTLLHIRVECRKSEITGRRKNRFPNKSNSQRHNFALSTTEKHRRRQSFAHSLSLESIFSSSVQCNEFSRA